MTLFQLVLVRVWWNTQCIVFIVLIPVCLNSVIFSDFQSIPRVVTLMVVFERQEH